MQKLFVTWYHIAIAIHIAKIKKTAQLINSCPWHRSPSNVKETFIQLFRLLSSTPL